MTASTYALLIAAIVAEVIATTALARSDSFTRLMPSVGAVVGYVVAFWLLSFPLRSMPASLVYAIWSGLGIVLLTAVTWVRYNQTLDGPALVGLGLISAGVVIINLFSKSTLH